MEELRVMGRVRKTGTDRPLELNQHKEVLVGQGFPRYTEMTRRGNGYSLIATAAVAGLVVRPGTVSALTLWNGNAAGGASYIIDRLFSHGLVSGAEAAQFALWACIHPAGLAAITSELAASATNLTGSYGKTYNGNAVVELGRTVVDNGWYPWGYSSDMEPTGILPGAAVSVDVDGRLIVPPTGAISLHVVASKTDETFCSGLSWWEEQITLG